MISKNKTTSAEYWLSRVVFDNSKRTAHELTRLERKMMEAVKREVPDLVSATLERTCNQQCLHCIYQCEKTSADISRQYKLREVIINIVRQMPKNGSFLHDGRILQNWHLDIFSDIRKNRPDIKIGLIDNGSYTRLLDEIKNKKIKLDWIDISVDGTEKVHNQQRDPVRQMAFQTAINGLRQARQIVKEGGRVSSLFTTTTINYKDVAKTADLLLTKDRHTNKPLADLFLVTTMAPARPEHGGYEISTSQLGIAWQQIKAVDKKYNPGKKRRFGFSLFRIEDLEKIALAVGEKKFINSLDSALVGDGMIDIKLDSTFVRYSPLSIWPTEEFFIDADAANRVALSLQYTIKELRQGYAISPDKKRINISAYTNQQLTAKSNYIRTYKKEAKNWWQFFGEDALNKEIGCFARLRKSAGSGR